MLLSWGWVRVLSVECVSSFISFLKAQWEYVDGDKYEPYPDEINVIIENTFKEKKPFAEWEEQDARFRVNFESMEEVTVNGNAPTVKVRRVTKGNCESIATFIQIRHSLAKSSPT